MPTQLQCGNKDQGLLQSKVRCRSAEMWLHQQRHKKRRVKRIDDILLPTVREERLSQAARKAKVKHI